MISCWIWLHLWFYMPNTKLMYYSLCILSVKFWHPTANTMKCQKYLIIKPVQFGGAWKFPIPPLSQNSLIKQAVPASCDTTRLMLYTRQQLHSHMPSLQVPVNTPQLAYNFHHFSFRAQFCLFYLFSLTLFLRLAPRVSSWPSKRCTEWILQTLRQLWSKNIREDFYLAHVLSSQLAIKLNQAARNQAKEYILKKAEKGNKLQLSVHSLSFKEGIFGC